MDEHSEMENEYVGGFVPIMKAEGDATIREAGAIAVVAGGNANIKEGGAGFCIVGGDVTINQGGTGNLIVGGSAELHEAAVGQMAALEVSVTDGRVGVLLAAKANLEGSEIMLSTPQAVGIGAAAGVVLFFLGRLFGRK